MKSTWLTTLFLFTFSFSTPNVVANDQEEIKVDDKIYIIRHNINTMVKGSENNFTGYVTISPLITAKDPLDKSAGYATFQAGARTNWHTHPNGQMLIGVAGKGRIQKWGDDIIEINPGEVVWVPAGVKHWHGASPDYYFTHFALADIVDGKSSDWLEKVTESQYQSK